jgi:hypothetical protein
MIFSTTTITIPETAPLCHGLEALEIYDLDLDGKKCEVPDFENLDSSFAREAEIGCSLERMAFRALLGHFLTENESS